MKNCFKWTSWSNRHFFSFEQNGKEGGGQKIVDKWDGSSTWYDSERENGHWIDRTSKRREHRKHWKTL